MQESETRFRVNKKAVIAFVLALAGIINLPAMVVAVVLWFLARRDVRKDPRQRGFKLASIGLGFALVANVLILGLIVALVSQGPERPTILWFIERTFFSGAQVRNEAEAMESVLAIRAALNKFYKERGGYPGSLPELVSAGLLDLRHVQPQIGRYTFGYEVRRSDAVPGKSLFSKFFLSAEPQPLFAKRRILMMETGVIGVFDRWKEGVADREIPPPDDWAGSLPEEQKEANAPSQKPLDLNKATLEELQKLPGIGPVTAKAIVRFREKSGPFRRLEDLLAIRGITKRKLETLRPYLFVEPPSPKKVFSG